MKTARAIPFFASFVLVVVSACSTKEAPNDCGSPDMAFVTFLPASKSLDPPRICIDIHAASRLDASATSAGRDESYAVSRPGVYPWTNLTFREASEACGRAGKFLCDWDALKAITAIAPSAPGFVTFDSTTIEALPRNGPETSMASRTDPLNPVDMLIRGETGKPAFPETRASAASFTIVPTDNEDEADPRVAYVLGAVSGKKVASGVARQGAVPQDFKHPLVGFRCCSDARVRDAFPALAPSPSRVRPTVDEEVPLAP